MARKPSRPLDRLVATPSPLLTIDEEDLSDAEEWELSEDPATLKTFRSAGKSTHTKSVRKLMLAIRMKEDRETIRTLRAILVRDYGALEAKHDRYISVARLAKPQLNLEVEWLAGVITTHQNVLEDADKYLDSIPAPSIAPSSSTKSSRSSRSSRTSHSSVSTQAKLLEAERLEKEKELQLRQAETEAQRQLEESERLRQMEMNRKREESKIEAERNTRMIKDQLEVARLASDLLRQEIADTSSGASSIQKLPQTAITTSFFQSGQATTTNQHLIPNNCTAATSSHHSLPDVYGARSEEHKLPDSIVSQSDVFGARHRQTNCLAATNERLTLGGSKRQADDSGCRLDKATHYATYTQYPHLATAPTEREQQVNVSTGQFNALHCVPYGPAPPSSNLTSEAQHGSDDKTSSKIVSSLPCGSSSQDVFSALPYPYNPLPDVFGARRGLANLSSTDKPGSLLDVYGAQHEPGLSDKPGLLLDVFGAQHKPGLPDKLGSLPDVFGARQEPALSENQPGPLLGKHESQPKYNPWVALSSRLGALGNDNRNFGVAPRSYTAQVPVTLSSVFGAWQGSSAMKGLPTSSAVEMPNGPASTDGKASQTEYITSTVTFTDLPPDVFGARRESVTTTATAEALQSPYNSQQSGGPFSSMNRPFFDSNVTTAKTSEPVQGVTLMQNGPADYIASHSARSSSDYVPLCHPTYSRTLFHPIPAYGPHSLNASEQRQENSRCYADPGNYKILPPTITDRFIPGNSFVPHNPAAEYTPDGWIFELQQNSTADRHPFAKPPETKLPYFDGDPKNWPMFIQDFKVQVHDACTHDSQRLIHLRSSIAPEIRSQLGVALLNPGLYRHALNELHRKFGNPRIVSASCSASLLQLQPFKDGDFKALCSFSHVFRSIVATLSLGGYGMELKSNSTLLQLENKLPPALRSKWGETSYRLPHLPTLEDFDRWLDDVVMAESCVRGGFGTVCCENDDKPEKPASNKPGWKPNRTSRRVFNTSIDDNCPACDKNHRLEQCEKFKEMKVDERCDLVRERRCCYRCLDSHHISPDCTKTAKCGLNGCMGLHHRLLHGAPPMYPKTSRPADLPSTPSAPFSGANRISSANSVTLLPIVPVLLKANGQLVRTNALLDCGSEITLIRQDFAAKLRLDGPTETTRISTFHSRDPKFITQRVNFQVESIDQADVIKIQGAYTVPSLNLSKRSVNRAKILQRWPHLRGIALPPTDHGEVTVLIGSDHPAALEIIRTKSDLMNKRSPRAILTVFGWCLIGPVLTSELATSPTSQIHQCNRISLGSRRADDNLEHLVEQFVNIDGFGINPVIELPVPPDEKRAIQILKDTTRLIDGRYEVGLLWKSDFPNLPNNRPVASRRFNHLERRFAADNVLAKRYSQVINEYITLGHARKLTTNDLHNQANGRIWYLPHHPVFNPNKPTKCRVVFDASASYEGTSLNSQLLKGPDYLTNMVGVLLRFREHRVGVSADVVKMFHQVRVRPIDTSALRFIWREPGSPHPPDDYQMVVQIFGAVSSPAICSHALHQAARDSGPDWHIVLNQIIDHFYMDNWLVSFRSVDEANDAANILTSALAKAGFELAQWGSSSLEVLANRFGQPISSLNLDLESLPVERTLGLTWSCSNDVFNLQLKTPAPVHTKRELLRAVASIFDPVGFLSAILLTPKNLLRSATRSDTGWDNPLDSTILDRWQDWVQTLPALEPLQVKRCFTVNEEDVLSTELHTFSDASENGIGAIVYLLFRYANSIEVTFVMSKAKVAPIRSRPKDKTMPVTFHSIPRLELCSNVIGLRLSRAVTKELRIKIDKEFFWTDSTTVLRWINSASCRFHVFVGNRIGEILESSTPSQWRYVPSAYNPADDCSRGICPSQLSAKHRFFYGPDFLQRPPESWPTFPDVTTALASEAEDPEVRSNNWIGAIRARAYDKIDSLIKKISRPQIIFRTVARIIRWFQNAKVPKESRVQDRATGALTVEEVQTAYVFILRRAQESAYSDEYDDLRKQGHLSENSRLLSLSPFIDERGLLCAGGRLDRAPMPWDWRHPVILPADNRITELIIFELHTGLMHLSPERTFHESRKMYWIPSGRATVHRIVNKCMKCRRLNARSIHPIMAELPAFRLDCGAPAFTHTGVDYFGPYEVNIFRRKVKRWACLFTCLTSRAVHIEMAYSLDTDSFISAMERFEMRRRTPASYHSDNGTNFVGAERELAECLASLDQTTIDAKLCRKGVKWYFNPPVAPHFGGVWERLVRSAKRALHFVLNGQTLTDEILITALTQAENLLNGRPLTYITADSNEPEALTPHHLLTGSSNPNRPPEIFDNFKTNTKKRWRFIQSLTEHFWRRWMREYAPTLIERKKWFIPQRNLAVGDIVVVIDPSNPRGQWPLGRILEVFHGADGVVRSAKVWTKRSEFHRQAAQLHLLERADATCASAPAGCRAGNVPNAEAEAASGNTGEIVVD